MGAKFGGDDEDGIVDINITPFVDIVLVILIIFMVTASTIAKQAIKIELPEAATGESTENISLGLNLSADGLLSLDGEEITRKELRAHIVDVLKTNEDVIALIAADKAVPHGSVVEIIDLVRQEGVAKFAINIDPIQLPAPQAETR